MTTSQFLITVDAQPGRPPVIAGVHATVTELCGQGRHEDARNVLLGLITAAEMFAPMLDTPTGN